MNEPKILLKPEPASDEILEINLGSIKVKSSKPKKDKKNVVFKGKQYFTWLEVIDIEMKNMKICTEKGGTRSDFTKEFDFNLEIIKYNALYPESSKIQTSILNLYL